MNSVVEKLAAIEKEVAAIQPKMGPLTERIANLAQKATDLAQQLTGVAEESAIVKKDFELTRQGLVRIQTLISESRAESEQLVAGQEENLQRCETMQAVFGTAFQAVSQFFEAAQRMGLADQAKAVFLNSPPLPTEVATGEPCPSIPDLPTVPEPPVSEELPSTDMPLDELPTWEPPTMESVLAESNFSTPLPSEGEEDVLPPVPGLPDVAAPPDIVDQGDLDAADLNSNTDTEPSDDIASELDVPPLNLSVLPPPDQSEMETESDTDDIEALLASMGAPVTASAGN